jgi:hypothetical protein
MSILKSPGLTRNETAFEIDMRNLLRSKKSGASNETEVASIEASSLVSQISGQSIREIDHLIEGLEGVLRSWTMRVIAFSTISGNTEHLANR